MDASFHLKFLMLVIVLLFISQKANATINCECEVCQDVMGRMFKIYNITSNDWEEELSVYETMDLIQSECKKFNYNNMWAMSRKQMCEALGAFPTSIDSFSLRVTADLLIAAGGSDEESFCHTIRGRVYTDVCSFCFPKNAAETAEYAG
mmetsp:Transcript_1274/g.1800  ORF Transcript_1274/g.1800 Transcript_1274/m.1800 type:complete len:149 (+) Transcript_1274:2121-2567(+)